VRFTSAATPLEERMYAVVVDVRCSGDLNSDFPPPKEAPPAFDADNVTATIGTLRGPNSRISLPVLYRQHQQHRQLLHAAVRLAGWRATPFPDGVLRRNSSAPVRLRSGGRLRRHRASSVRRQASARRSAANMPYVILQQRTHSGYSIIQHSYPHE
jgi:hypothetical protein